MSQDLKEIRLHDEQDPTLLTEAGIVHKALKDNLQAVFEKAIVEEIMRSYEARAMASGATDTTHGTYGTYAEAQGHHRTASAFAEAAEAAGLECRDIEELHDLARGKLLKLHTESLDRLLAIERPEEREKRGQPRDYQHENSIWQARTMLHLLDEPHLPDLFQAS